MATAVKRLDALFRDLKFEDGRRYSVPAQIVEVTTQVDKRCDVHGGSSSSLVVLHRRGSVPAVELAPPPPASLRRRDSLVLGSSAPKEMHPSSFASTLRKDSSDGAPLFPHHHAQHRRDSLSKRRYSTDSLDSVRRNSWDPSRRGSSGSSGAGCEDPIWEEVNMKCKVGGDSVTCLLSSVTDGRQVIHLQLWSAYILIVVLPTATCCDSQSQLTYIHTERATAALSFSNFPF